MKSYELELIRADVVLAKNIFYSMTRDNPFLLNQVAYHAGQAMEKALKAILREENALKDGLKTTHSFESLLVSTELVKKGFVTEHPLIASNYDEFSKLNNLRYGKKQVLEEDAKMLLEEAERLFEELKGLTNIKKADYKKEVNKYYTSLEKAKFERGI